MGDTTAAAAAAAAATPPVLVPVKPPANWQVFIIAMLIVLMFGATCAWAIWTKDASAQWLVPVLATVFGNATGFYLGSSSSSHAKDATIAAQVQTGSPKP